MTPPQLRDVLAAEREIMNELAPVYESHPRANSYVYQRERRAFVAWLLARLHRSGIEPKEQRFLDAGCGPGDLLKLLAEEGCEHLAGVDLADRMLSVAQRARIPGLDLVCSCIEAPPFAGPHFDVVVSAFTIHHLNEPRAFFRMLEGLLRPGGWFFLLEYDRYAFESRARKATVEPWAAALRRILRFKNRAYLARTGSVALRFNPVHQLRSFDEIVASMLNPEDYELDRHSSGLLTAAFTNVVDGDSRFDRKLVHGLEGLDRGLGPRFGGAFHWIAGRRRARPPAGVPGRP